MGGKIGIGVLYALLTRLHRGAALLASRALNYY